MVEREDAGPDEDRLHACRRAVDASPRRWARLRPDIWRHDALCFTSAAGTCIAPNNFLKREWRRVVRRRSGGTAGSTPHILRRTFASLHLSRGTNLLCVQRQDGWESAQVMLSTYSHLVSSELSRFADAISGDSTSCETAPDGTKR
jgi:integrase